MNISNWQLSCRKKYLTNSLFFLIVIITAGSAGCGLFRPSDTVKAPVFLTPETAEKEQLFANINRLAQVKSIRGKVYVKFEDNSFAESGIIEKYKTAEGQVIVQAPLNINLRIQLPVVGTDLVNMTSDGEKFRVAVPCCVDKQFRRFVFGTNAADYSRLQEKAKDIGKGDERKAIGVFSSLRPQHFTVALLMQPIENGSDFVYTQTEIYQEEADPHGKSAASRVIRGYYLLDELKKNGDSGFSVSRRFWFDRVGSVRLARQQIFSENGVIIADLAYGAEQKFGENAQYSLPVQVQITRPQERYSVRLTFQAPQEVSIGEQFKQQVFQLENKWELPEVDLDKQAIRPQAQQPQQ
jgi:hypothetical protein